LKFGKQHRVDEDENGTGEDRCGESVKAVARRIAAIARRLEPPPRFINADPLLPFAGPDLTPQPPPPDNRGGSVPSDRNLGEGEGELQQMMIDKGKVP
jgi:hypothetical protein